MARPLTEVVHEIYAKYEAMGGEYSTKQIEEDVREAYEAGEVLEDPVEERIRAAVNRRDKTARQEPDGQLIFPAGAFPHVLVIGDSERQPTAPAVSRHVFADQAIKEDAHIKNAEAMQRLRRRNLAILPYLEAGMTVAAAIEAWKNDQ